MPAVSTSMSATRAQTSPRRAGLRPLLPTVLMNLLLHLFPARTLPIPPACGDYLEGAQC
jgi:hypothetical protein